MCFSLRLLVFPPTASRRQTTKMSRLITPVLITTSFIQYKTQKQTYDLLDVRFCKSAVWTVYCISMHVEAEKEISDTNGYKIKSC